MNIITNLVDSQCAARGGCKPEERARLEEFMLSVNSLKLTPQEREQLFSAYFSAQSQVGSIAIPRGRGNPGDDFPWWLILGGAACGALLAYLISLLTRAQPYTRTRPRNSPCNPTAFAAWWNSLPPVPQSVKPNSLSYQYENTVCRNAVDALPGQTTMRIAQGTSFQVDGDGANDNNCRLLDCKYSDPRNPQYRINPPAWIDADVTFEFQRYRLAIARPNGWPGGQPTGLEVRTNLLSAIPYLELKLVQAGFTPFVDGFVALR
jgi:hypothetical protein